MPCQHARAQVNVGVTRSTVEVFQRGQSIASHAPCTFEGRHTTVAARMPTAHREVANSSLDRLTARAATVGPRCWVPLERLLCKRLAPPHRSNLDVLSLWQKYCNARQELRTRPKV